jgi:uncharacterized protein YjbI with pentapeptide repeats
MNLAFSSPALYGLVLPVAMVIGVAGRRRSRRPRERSGAGAIGDGRSATAVTPPRLPRRRLRALVIEGTDVRGYDLRRARLTGLVLTGIALAGLDLTGASFRKSNLVGADLRHTILDHVDLSGCDLRDADLRGASLLETDFGGADLRRANLTGCRQMAMINLRGARFDRLTQWPGGIDLSDSGAIRER